MAQEEIIIIIKILQDWLGYNLGIKENLRELLEKLGNPDIFISDDAPHPLSMTDDFTWSKALREHYSNFLLMIWSITNEVQALREETDFMGLRESIRELLETLNMIHKDPNDFRFSLEDNRNRLDYEKIVEYSNELPLWLEDLEVCIRDKDWGEDDTSELENIFEVSYNPLKEIFTPVIIKLNRYRSVRNWDDLDTWKQRKDYEEIYGRGSNASHWRLDNLKREITALLNQQDYNHALGGSITTLIDNLKELQKDLVYPLNSFVEECQRFDKIAENAMELHCRLVTLKWQVTILRDET